MSLAAGTRLGPYEVAAQIGAGGTSFDTGAPVALFQANARENLATTEQLF